MISRGTTTHHTFILPSFEEDISKIYVTYSQKETEIVTKIYNSDDIEHIDDTLQIVVNLSQLETCSFTYTGIPSKDAISIQLRILTIGDEAYVSNIITENVGRLLKEGVISG